MDSFEVKIAKTAGFIRENDNFLLIAHDRPDGDTIGSTLALHLALKKIGKKSLPVCSGSVPKVFQFLASSSVFEKDFLFGDFEAIILIDNGDLKRSGFDSRIRQYFRLKKPIINIDHHPQNDIWKLAKINLVNDQLSSTAEIIFELISTIDQKLIDSDMATAIMTGIYTDTGGFQHPTTTPRILNLASRLLSLGAKLKIIKKNIDGKHPFSTLKLWGLVLKNLTVNNEYGIILSVVTRQEIRESGGSEEELAGVVNMINTAPGACVALLIYETENGKVKGSLRTESDMVDVSFLASLLNGGGHKRAAGFSFSGRIVKNDHGYQIV